MTKTYIQIDGQSYDAGTVTHPGDRTFRDAWQLDGSVIDVDIASARDIHRDRIRQERLAAFDPFDKIATPLSRKAAAGNPLTTQEISDLNAAEASAQKLRDAPSHASIDAASTPEELKLLTLAALTA